jgi:pSer/pThr/pTyr-binding forkhead associated (FHA) protein
MNQENSGGAYLVIQRGDTLGKRVELWKERTSIGRSRDCDIFLEDIAVHRKQASIFRTISGYLLRDDNGSGDSFVNGQMVTERVLNSGDQLRFGATQITFYANEGTRPFQLPSSRGRELLQARIPDPHSTVIARLYPVDGRSGLRSFELLPDMTIGRSRECDIFLEDLAVSRHHATLRELPNGAYELIDNRSATGTFVNGRSVARQELHEGDVIQIGSNSFTFRFARS